VQFDLFVCSSLNDDNVLQFKTLYLKCSATFIKTQYGDLVLIPNRLAEPEQQIPSKNTGMPTFVGNHANNVIIVIFNQQCQM